MCDESQGNTSQSMYNKMLSQCHSIHTAITSIHCNVPNMLISYDFQHHLGVMTAIFQENTALWTLDGADKYRKHIKHIIGINHEGCANAVTFIHHFILLY